MSDADRYVFQLFVADNASNSVQALNNLRAICRLHTVLCLLVAGGLPRNLSAARAAAELRRIRPTDQVGIERRRLAVELLTEVRSADRDLTALKTRITTAVAASSTTVTEVFGVGPVLAAYLIGYSGDVQRFPTAGSDKPLANDVRRSRGTPGLRLHVRFGNRHPLPDAL